MGRKRLHIDNILTRNSISFKQRLDIAKTNRIKLGLDKKMVGDARLTDAIAKHPTFELLMRDIERKPNKESLL